LVCSTIKNSGAGVTFQNITPAPLFHIGSNLDRGIAKVTVVTYMLRILFISKLQERRIIIVKYYRNLGILNIRIDKEGIFMGIVSPTTNKMQSCIEACQKCAQACYECFSACLNEPDLNARKNL